jgi:probable HAF family extracellular repeat protein
MRDLGTLDGNPGSTSGAEGINDNGQIVGESYSQAVGTHAVEFTPDGVKDLGTLGGVSSARAVNDLGQVVGDSYGAFGHHAFVTDLQGGPMVDLNTLIPPNTGWVLFEATGINNAGQITGTGQLPGYDNIHAYLLTPEPPALAPVIIALQAGQAVASFPELNTGSRLCDPQLRLLAAETGMDVRGSSQPMLDWCYVVKETANDTGLPSQAVLDSRSVAVLSRDKLLLWNQWNPLDGRMSDGQTWLMAQDKP